MVCPKRMWRVTNSRSDVTNQLCTTGRAPAGPPLLRPLETQQSRQNWCSRTFMSLFDFLCFSSLKNILWHFYFSQCFFPHFICVVYWNNAALCQKRKKKVRNFRVNCLFITGPICVLDVWRISPLCSLVKKEEGSCFPTYLTHVISLLADNKCFHTQLLHLGFVPHSFWTALVTTGWLMK